MTSFFSPMSVALLTVVLLTGCLKTRAELEAQESGQQTAQETRRQQKEHAAGAPVIREKAPPTAYRFEEYDQQMREFSGKIEAVEAQNTQLYNLMKAEREGAAKEKAIADQKQLALEEALKKMEGDIAQLTEKVEQLKAPAPAAATPVVGGKAKTVFDEAEDQFTARKWKEAIVNYQKYRDKNPKGKSYVEATYKIGLCFQELGLKDEAKAFFEEVTVKFPKSKEAKKAAFRMKSLK